MRDTAARTLALPLALALMVSACSEDPQQFDTSEREGRPVDSGPTVEEGGRTDTGSGTDSGSGIDTGADTEPAVRGVGGGETELEARLDRLDDCETLLDRIRDWAAAHVGPWGFDHGPAYAIDYVAQEGAAGTTASTSGAGEPAPAFRRRPPVEGVDYSGTNVQEAGVDETDIIKTDGLRIFVMSAGRLVVVDAARRVVLGSVQLPDSDSAELFLEGDSLLAIQQTDDRYGVPQSVIHRIDVRGGEPEVVETIRVEGSYVSARSMAGVARVILRSQPQEDFPFVYPPSPDSEAAAQEANRTAVLASSLEDWLPTYSHTDSGGATTEGLLPSCERMHAPTVFSGFGVTTVLSVPVAGDINPATATSVLAPGEVVYASTESLYVSTATWIDSSWSDIDWNEFRAEFRTNIHRFDITDPAKAVYTASGSVPGEIHNQFALSEHAGHLRVVTTTTRTRGDGSETSVRVLAESDSQLIEVGSAGDIGRGEQVHSVRFIGDAGYVATSGEAGSLHTVDLSAPAEPAVVGELEIPGSTSYLHPLADGMVVGVGSDTDEGGWTRGATVSLFDVSNLASPREVTAWTTPSSWNYLARNERAFLWWAPERLAMIPMTVDYERSEAIVFTVAGGTFREAGQIVLLPLGAGPTSCRRLSEADVLGSVDVTLSELGARVAELVVQTPRSVIIVACEPGEEPVAGFQCEAGDFSAAEEESLRQWIDITDREDLWACLPPDPAERPRRHIVRSLVIGDELWILSRPIQVDGNPFEGQLQANDLKTLEFLDAVDL